MLEVGTIVKDFSLPDSEGNIRKLSEFYGKPVVLYIFIQKMIHLAVRLKHVHFEINMKILHLKTFKS